MTSRQRSKYTANWLRPNTCVKKKLSLLEKTPKIIAISLGAWAVKTCLCGNEVCKEKVPQKLLLEKQRLVCVTHNLLVCVKFPFEFTSVVVGCSDGQTLRVCLPIPWLCPFPNCDLFLNSTKEFCCIKWTQQPMIRKAVNNKKEKNLYWFKTKQRDRKKTHISHRTWDTNFGLLVGSFIIYSTSTHPASLCGLWHSLGRSLFLF